MWFLDPQGIEAFVYDVFDFNRKIFIIGPGGNILKQSTSS